MARTGVVDSATSQFFINLVNNASLDFQNSSPSGYGYTAFGRVIEGMEVVDEIARVATGNVRGYSDVPLEPVIITTLRRGD
jgi:cyclophilin family peptidyl-prolyl cis-trans isomerase